MQPSVPEIVARASHRTFGRPLLEYECIDIVVDAMIESALAPGWRIASGRLFTGRFVHFDGIELLVRAHTVLNESGMRRARPRTWSTGCDPDIPRDHPILRDDPQIVVFAYHGEDDPLRADHRDVNQWAFYVVERSRLPWTREIATSEVAAMTSVSSFTEIVGAVEWARKMVATPALFSP